MDTKPTISDYLAYGRTAQKFMRMEDYATAQKIYIMALTEFPNDDTFLNGITLCCRALNDYLAANAYNARALELYPHDETALRQQAAIRTESETVAYTILN